MDIKKRIKNNIDELPDTILGTTYSITKESKIETDRHIITRKKMCIEILFEENEEI